MELNDLEKNLLTILYENQGERPPSSRMIHHDLKEYVDFHNVEHALRNLKAMKLIRTIRKPAVKATLKGQWSSPAQDVYEIDLKGVQCYQNNFQVNDSFPSDSRPPLNQIIFNSPVIFGDNAKIENNFYEILNTINITHEQKTEISNVFQSIEKEMKQESVDKSKVKSLLKTLVDKGTTKLFEAALSAVIKEFIH